MSQLPHSDALNEREKFYTHYLSRGAWHGSRIIMRQVSPESPDIFDFIMNLYHACDGKWNTLVAQCNITPEELTSFLEYAAMFLCNLGNFYSGYYPTEEPITRDEIAKVSEILNKKSTGPENTRIRKMLKDGKPVLQLLQTSAETDPLKNGGNELADGIFLVRGDHLEELANK
ncbi:hypothetical protein V8C42DRAFT_345281 [Trichoderma barbatum]